MKRALMAGLLLSICVAALATDATTEFKAFLATIQPKVEKAFAAKDIKFFEAIETADFTYTSGKQVSDKKTSLAGMAQMFQMCKTLSSEIGIISANASGKTGVAVMDETLHATTGPTGPNDKAKTHKMVMKERVKMTWVRVGDAWKVKSIVSVGTGTMTMDGKPYTPK